MPGLFKLIFDIRTREAVQSILEVLAETLEDGIEEGEALQALNDIAKILVDLLLPGKDVQVNVDFPQDEVK